MTFDGYEAKYGSYVNVFNAYLDGKMAEEDVPEFELKYRDSPAFRLQVEVRVMKALEMLVQQGAK